MLAACILLRDALRKGISLPFSDIMCGTQGDKAERCLWRSYLYHEIGDVTVCGISERFLGGEAAVLCGMALCGASLGMRL